MCCHSRACDTRILLHALVQEARETALTLLFPRTFYCCYLPPHHDRFLLNTFAGPVAMLLFRLLLALDADTLDDNSNAMLLSVFTAVTLKRFAVSSDDDRPASPSCTAALTTLSYS